MLGLLALMGVSVETAVILVSCFNKVLLEQGMSNRKATHKRPLPPIVVSALVAGDRDVLQV